MHLKKSFIKLKSILPQCTGSAVPVVASHSNICFCKYENRKKLNRKIWNRIYTFLFNLHINIVRIKVEEVPNVKMGLQDLHCLVTQSVKFMQIRTSIYGCQIKNIGHSATKPCVHMDMELRRKCTKFGDSTKNSVVTIDINKKTNTAAKLQNIG